MSNYQFNAFTPPFSPQRGITAFAMQRQKELRQ